MIGRKKPRIQDRQPRVESLSMPDRRWLMAGMLVCAAAMAAPPSPGAPPPPQDVAEDDFIEFLGADDVGDAAWWEFLKKVPPRGENPPAPPPQEVKQ